jgi:signal transduction histidine kinase
MRDIPEVVRRNRTIILSVTVMVILPSILLAFFGFRAIRSDALQGQAQQRQRQQQIALWLETELKSWLFSEQPDAAISESLLKFRVDGERIVFPDFEFSIPPEKYVNPVPFASSKRSPREQDSVQPNAIPNLQTIEDIYYPRIQAFLRDFDLKRNSGAQYFRRLEAMVVQIPGTATGYVLSASRLMEYARRQLDQMTASEDFSAELWIAETGEPKTEGAEIVPLKNFALFQIVFTPNTTAFDLRGRILFYSIALLTVVTVLGIVLMYRAVTHEMAIARLRADFVSAVSHEFRTPLSSMLALLERLESGHVSDTGMLRRYHQSLRQETQRLGLLTDKLLDFAQIEEGKRKFSFERLELDDLTAGAMNIFQESRFAERIDLERCGVGTTPEIHADRTAVIQCIQNLVENALKYSPPESKIVVRCGTQDGVPFVEVIDQGMGIDPADQERIFEKFYRGANARAGNVHGTGIGLTLVKRIMDAHGGDVVVATRIMDAHGGDVVVATTPGKGSCFRLVFPKA